MEAVLKCYIVALHPKCLKFDNPRPKFAKLNTLLASNGEGLSA